MIQIQISNEMGVKFVKISEMEYRALRGTFRAGVDLATVEKARMAYAQANGTEYRPL